MIPGTGAQRKKADDTRELVRRQKRLMTACLRADPAGDRGSESVPAGSFL